MNESKLGVIKIILWLFTYCFIREYWIYVLISMLVSAYEYNFYIGPIIVYFVFVANLVSVLTLNKYCLVITARIEENCFLVEYIQSGKIRFSKENNSNIVSISSGYYSNNRPTLRSYIVEFSSCTRYHILKSSNIPNGLHEIIKKLKDVYPEKLSHAKKELTFWEWPEQPKD